MSVCETSLSVTSLHLSGLLSLQKAIFLSILDSMQRFPMGHTSRKGSSFAFCMKCSRDINLGRGGTRDLRRHQEMKLYKHSEKDGVGYCLYSHKKMVWGTASTFLLWANKRGVCDLCNSTLRIFP